MKKVLCLSLITYSIFSMQLDTFKSNYSKIKAIRQKMVKQHSSKLDYVKQHCPKLNDNVDNIKQCIEPSSFFASKGLGKVKLFHDEKGFHILHNNKMHYVQPCFTDSIVRNVTPQQIKDFQKTAKGYLYINQMGNREFSLEVRERVRGGGPAFGAFMYWLTKSLCYGTMIAAAGTVAVASGGAVAGAVAGTGAVATTATTGVAVGVASHTAAAAGAIAITEVAAATTVASVTTAAAATGVSAVGATAVVSAASTAVSIGTGLTGAAITGAGLAGEAAAVTGAVISTGATTGGIIAGIEALSLTIGTFFGMLPTP